MVSDTADEAKWRAEFEAVGETQLRDGMTRCSMPFPEPKRQFAFRWLREQENAKPSASGNCIAMRNGRFGPQWRRPSLRS